ncbi:MAG: molybdopterin-dependent oxidoreductase [Planctomycetes bacterium]|nr:molybdopterin-dependent oxidoreductase [Planctomycetota bacterium]NUQ33543.1 molybdopterin-dependent oxidoreductase [Planctomycetaceae bacterium]
MKASLIEKIASKLGFIPDLGQEHGVANPVAGIETSPFPLSSYPPEDAWDHWEEFDAQSWPLREKRAYSIVPTTCFNCESACGLLAYVDKADNNVRKFEGNPLHPGSRGRNCAKGPATKNQIDDPDRILYPLKRAGARGEGKWQRVSWAEALKDIGGRIGAAFDAQRQNHVVYHVGRPGHEGYMDRVLNGWGIDGHNSHTTICSAGARHGYSLWMKHDRPSPDHTNAKLILLVSAHLESGHYFNPHAQRIMEGVMKGAKLVVLDPRLSNTASMADEWIPCYPGSEAAIFLAVARLMLINKTYSEKQFKHWTNWREFMAAEHPKKPQTFEAFCDVLLELWADFTPEFAAKEAQIPVAQIHTLYNLVAKCEGRLAAHTWRAGSIGNLGGWQVARTLHLLSVMTGGVGVKGGTLPSAWNKFKPSFFVTPPAHKFWNQFQFPDEWSVAQYEMSHCLPHLLREKNEKIDVYFTRVFNPVWTYPDGFSWIEMLRNEQRIGLHVALTPTWNETAYFADYVLPMGHGSERHDLNSYETDSGMWIAFRQPVLREVARRAGKTFKRTYEVNPGEVWEEDEFWIDLSWAIDPDGERGIRRYFESPHDPKQPVSVDEYYEHIFNNVPGLPEAAKARGLSPLDYMRRVGAFQVREHCYGKHLAKVNEGVMKDAHIDDFGRVLTGDGRTLGVMVDGVAYEGFPTPSRRMEIWSGSMKEHGWPEKEYTLPFTIKSHVHPDNVDRDKGEMCLIPTFRLPTLIHTRTGQAKWLNEISNMNPLWMHPDDLKRYQLRNGDLVRVNTEIGYFVDRVWATEAIKPGICACSHHMGRWRRPGDPNGNRYSANLVDIVETAKGQWKMTPLSAPKPFKSNDPDSERIFWGTGGVHQNAAAPIHPDPVSGGNCWLQKIRIEKAKPSDNYGDVVADTDKAHEVYLQWKALCRPVTKQGAWRRIPWLNRPLAPTGQAWKKD